MAWLAAYLEGVHGVVGCIPGGCTWRSWLHIWGYPRLTLPSTWVPWVSSAGPEYSWQRSSPKRKKLFGFLFLTIFLVGSDHFQQQRFWSLCQGGMSSLVFKKLKMKRNFTNIFLPIDLVKNNFAHFEGLQNFYFLFFFEFAFGNCSLK